MYTTTLRGVFPEPKPVYKRNFIKENVKHIKQMQGILQNSGLFESKPAREDKYRHRSMKSMSYLKGPPHKSRHTVKQAISSISKAQKISKQTSVDVEKGKGERMSPKTDSTTPEGVLDRISHRAVQTDIPEEINKLYEQGIIKYPSPSVLKTLTAKRSPKKKDRATQQDRGDSGGVIVSNPHNDELSNNMQNLDISDKHNYIKENIMAIKNKTARESPIDPAKSQQAYQRGVVPKYLKDRKEELRKGVAEDPECPEGHVLLPEEERRETLRVLRQTYADRIQELNSMPVRNDTLRMRKRKMAIEEELKKIDEGIKVFQRPKVFVKINA